MPRKENIKQKRWNAYQDWQKWQLIVVGETYDAHDKTREQAVALASYYEGLYDGFCAVDAAR